MNGVLETIVADTLYGRSKIYDVNEALSRLSKPFLPFETFTPTLHYSRPIPVFLHMIFCNGLRAFSRALRIASVNVGTSRP